MKILQINSLAKNGCVARIACGINKEILLSGYNGAIAFARGEEPLNIDTIRIGRMKDVYIHTLASRILDNQGLGSRKATLEFINNIKEYTPDIIHLHNIHGSYINMEILFEAINKLNIPIVWTLHDCWSFTGHCAYYDYIKCEKWKSGCYKCQRKKDYPKSYILDKSRKNYEIKKEIFTSVKNMTLVTPSQWLRSEVKKSFLRSYDTYVINNGIDLNIFKYTKSDFRVKYNIKNEIVILGVANKWHAIKGFNEFVKLSYSLDNKFKIVMVGEMSNRQKRQLSSHVILIDKTNNVEELAKIYSVADIFLNPTHEDNFPTTNIEALACGVPVITFNTGGSIEAIDNKSGLIVNSFSELLDILIKFDRNDFKRDNCIRRAQDFNQTTKFKEYIKLYEKILSERNGNKYE